MLVGVTGGTGFLGGHTVAALIRAGHRVRLLVRGTATRALGPAHLERSAVEVHVGDVTDRAAVAGWVRGVDAVLHAASVYSFDSRYAPAVRRVNVLGTEVVLDAACRAGADPIIHVSSFGALLPAADMWLRGDSPVGVARDPYLASKAAAETIARRHQQTGAPVVISYPPALLGPDGPGLGDQMARLRNLLRGMLPVWPDGGFPVGDVRDTAALHARLVDAPPAPARRFFGPGRYLSTREFVRLSEEATGRRLRVAFLPARIVLPVSAAVTLAQRVWPWPLPVAYGAVLTCACAARIGEGGDLVPARPAAETFRDAIGWLRRYGHLSATQAGTAGSGRG